MKEKIEIRPDLHSALRLYLARACGKVPVERRRRLEKYLFSATEQWARLPPNNRAQFVQSTIDGVPEAMLSASAAFEVIIGFSGMESESARGSADSYLRAMDKSLGRVDLRRRVEPRQLTLRINNISLKHPGLSEISAVVSGPNLTRKDLLRARNHVKGKKGRNPAYTKVSTSSRAMFLFSDFAVDQAT